MRRTLRVVGSIATAVLFLLLLVGPNTAHAATTYPYNDVTLPTPSWWSGTCDDNGYKNGHTWQGTSYAGAGVDSHQLGTASFEGVMACGPRPTGDSAPDVKTYFTSDAGASQENEWECTELVKRFLFLKYGVRSIGSTDGYQVAAHYASTYSNLFEDVTNDGTSQIQVGDILSYGTPDNHTAIVTDTSGLSSGTGYIWVMEQNADSSGKHQQYVSSWKIKYGVDDAQYSDGHGGYLDTVTDWLHAKTQITSVNPGTFSNQLQAVSADAANDAWAVGHSQDNTGHLYPLAEQWDGTQWTANSPTDSYTGDHYLTGVKAFSSTDVWAAGYYLDSGNTAHALVYHWNGSSWSVTSPVTGYLNAIDGTSDSDLWAVGEWSSGITLHYNGSSWSSVSNGSGSAVQFLGVSAYSSSDVWAVGTGSFGAVVSWHYDGSSWSEPGTDIAVTGTAWSVVDLGSSGTWVVGRNSNDLNFVVKWSGSSWGTATTISGYGSDNGLFGISAFSTTSLWAVGYYAPFYVEPLILHSDDGGSTWQQVTAVSSANYQFNGISVLPSTGLVWAVGTNGTATLTNLFA